MSAQTMIDAAWPDDESPEQGARPGERLAAALIAYAVELEDLAAATLAANKRGAKGRASIYVEGAALLRGRAAELETHGPISEAQSRRAAALAQTEAGAQRLTENARPNAADMAALNAFVDAACGVTSDMGHVCERDPHEPGTGSHMLMGPSGTPSVIWPDSRSQIAAFLLGDTDELPDLGPTGVRDLGPVDGDLKGVLTTLNEANPSLGVPVGHGLNGEMIIPKQEDIFRVADEPSPFAVASSATRPPWRLDPDPVPFAFDPSNAIGVPDHVSYSQITTAEACGLQLRIKKRHGVKGQPGYATVGGRAYHACVELIEMRRLDLISHGVVDQVLAGDLAACAALFVNNLDIGIAAATRESGVPVERWKVAAQGAEGDTWWRHNGALMLRDYVAWSDARHADGWSILHLPGKTLGIELELNEPVGHDVQLNRPVMLNGILDQVWFKWRDAGSTDTDGTPVLMLHIEDGKSGARPVSDTFQLGLYAHMLHRMVMREFPPPVAAKAVITGSYYDARNGKSGDPVHPLALHSWEEIEYRALTTLAMHAAGVYPANPKAEYGGPCGMCDVRHACPIMATRDWQQ